MRIAYVCHYFPPEPAAPAARVHELGRAWVAAGHRVTAITTFPNHPLGRIPARYAGRAWATEWLDGIRVLRCWLYAVPNRGVARRGLDHLSFMLTAVLFGLPRLETVDVVIASSPTLFSALAAWVMARLRRVPFVLEVRDLWPEAIVDLGLMRPGLTVTILERLARFLYHQAARVVVVTETFATRLQAQGVPPAKLAVISNGADTRLFTPATDGRPTRAALGLEDRFVVAYIGSHGLSHGLSAALDAAAQLPDVTFLLVGDGADRARLVAERDARGLANVVMQPSVEKDAVPGLYAAADVCLVPLRDVPLFDAFVPSKLFEVLAAGRPIVGAVRGEARAILERSGGALLVDPEHFSGQLVAAIARLRDDAPLRDELGAQGRAFAVEHYDRDRLAARYLDVLGDVVRPVILLVGGTGFLGNFVARHLATRRTVALVRSGSDTRMIPRDIPLVRGDLADPLPLDGVDTLVYCASMGFGHIPPLVAQLEQSDVRRAVFVSTTAIFTSLPTSSRAVRVAAEEAVMASSLDWTILRPTMIYGTGRDRNISRLLGYLKRWPVFPLCGDALWQPIYVADLADAVIAALDASTTSHRTYNLGGAAPLRFSELVHTAARAIDRRVQLIPVPVGLGVAAARVTKIVTPEQIRRLAEDKAFPYDDAARDFGFVPCTFADGVAREAASLFGGGPGHL